MSILSRVTIVAAALLAASQAHAQQVGASPAGTPRAVIELFTSQGCSSCPPADRLLSELSNDSSLLALSIPVDYWDYLGWKDTLAVPGNSHRQRAYARARGDREVFTPQAVVNGTAFALGSDKAAIDGAVTKSAAALTVPVKIAIASNKLAIDVAAKEGGRGEVWLCPVSQHVAVAIGRGENGGKHVTYTNVVRRWVKLGEWTGNAATFAVPLSEVAGDGIDAVAVLVQNGDTATPGPMVGASLAPLK